MAFLIFLVIIAGADSVPSGYKIINFGSLVLMSPKPRFFRLRYLLVHFSYSLPATNLTYFMR
ncbi:hypothetical protein ACVSTN_09420, partial [Yersinia enterocolitica]